jgi:hypothetical protein
MKALFASKLDLNLWKKRYMVLELGHFTLEIPGTF